MMVSPFSNLNHNFSSYSAKLTTTSEGSIYKEVIGLWSLVILLYQQPATYHLVSSFFSPYLLMFSFNIIPVHFPRLEHSNSNQAY